MNPKCGLCAKTVYPMEKMDGAGLTWHKGCFKCTKCKCTLNLKNFKAHENKLWCAVHYPPEQTKITKFGNDKKADSGTYESSATESHTDAGGAWGGGSADSGEYGNNPSSYDQGGDQGGYDQGGDQGGYDQGGYDQGGDQGGYDQGGDQGGYDQGGYDDGY
eukprot:TRINITY_DN1157_c0_g1_i1.p1 TRINITY_DN1157_c0_g1~~TRINITY_DN1157_c0_g1_i1.p1  ORF type:complete len:161 (+),score=47.48 TRINITY_DN1157_c0_g1_i1:91-573(+)